MYLLCELVKLYSAHWHDFLTLEPVFKVLPGYLNDREAPLSEIGGLFEMSLRLTDTMTSFSAVSPYGTLHFL